ncbi:CRISPR-associated protein, Cas6 family [Pilibacter termitis]|jgi:CRISPR-associated endoribonuclease Cas6|uniref:CRISPR-associated protein, Cas6 family n=1 Tax=Pilibacter termitis TaxID=263852 RepID=A0A1T4NDB5_9ENTE|nr:CRISPR-associated endoribonuclease Cas6 [Pilibacter termitis]SJZ77250.1 CRISPR-associated protein, Cas6 family [Pilibacter termitis]
MKRFTFILENEKKKKLYPRDLAPKLQGVLMQNLPSEVAESLHQREINPYSTWVSRIDEEYKWEINVIDDKLAQRIETIFFDNDFKEIVLRSYGDLVMNIKEKKKEVHNIEKLSRNFYEKEAPSKFSISFLSPTSFKSQGEYVFFPDIRLLIQSAMRKYQALNENDKEVDEHLLQELESRARVTSYRTKSQYFKVHQSSIPAFEGEVTISVNGNQTLKNYIFMLFSFAEYSGVGIKSSMGMGKIKLVSK